MSSPTLLDLDEPLLTPAEVANYLQVSKALVNSLIKSKRLRAFNVGLPIARKPLYRIQVEEFETFLRGQITEPTGRKYVPPKYGYAKMLYNPSPEFLPMGRLYTRQEVGELLHLKAEHITILIIYGHIKAVDVSVKFMQSRFRVSDRAIVEFVVRCTTYPRKEWHRELQVPEELKELEPAARKAIKVTRRSRY